MNLLSLIFETLAIKMSVIATNHTNLKGFSLGCKYRSFITAGGYIFLILVFSSMDRLYFGIYKK